MVSARAEDGLRYKSLTILQKQLLGNQVSVSLSISSVEKVHHISKVVFTFHSYLTSLSVIWFQGKMYWDHSYTNMICLVFNVQNLENSDHYKLCKPNVNL